mmetsp:Transcript_7055/g.22109  ORF Transcript_7055/g.22109 Transcript_7055/m.22109 type:complete len:87 (-) Transcript_7055:1008-1268(-)
MGKRRHAGTRGTATTHKQRGRDRFSSAHYAGGAGSDSTGSGRGEAAVPSLPSAIGDATAAAAASSSTATVLFVLVVAVTPALTAAR